MAGCCQMVDILRRGQRFHEELAAYCRQTRRHTHSDELRRALSVVGRHEAWLAHCIEAYTTDVPSKVAKAWFRGTPDDDTTVMLRHMRITEETEPDEAIAMTLEYDECLARLFSRLLDVAATPELRDALQGLLDLERSEEMKLSHQLQQI